jgi:hypothetical protein
VNDIEAPFASVVDDPYIYFPKDWMQPLVERLNFSSQLSAVSHQLSRFDMTVVMLLGYGGPEIHLPGFRGVSRPQPAPTQLAEVP